MGAKGQIGAFGEDSADMSNCVSSVIESLAAVVWSVVVLKFMVLPWLAASLHLINTD